MELIKPSLQYAASFVKAMNELRTIKEDSFYRALGSPQTISQYIQLVEKHEKSQDLPMGWVPYHTYWLIDNDRFIGELHFRQLLTDYLKNYGGHIGYTIRPSERRKGYGKQILKFALPEIQKLGFDRVLVTCNETNIASKKIIEANGGEFEKANAQGSNLPCKLLYWITLAE